MWQILINRNLGNWPAEVGKICRGKMWSLLYLDHSTLTYTPKTVPWSICTNKPTKKRHKVSKSTSDNGGDYWLGIDRVNAKIQYTSFLVTSPQQVACTGKSLLCRVVSQIPLQRLVGDILICRDSYFAVSTLLSLPGKLQENVCNGFWTLPSVNMNGRQKNVGTIPMTSSECV